MPRQIQPPPNRINEVPITASHHFDRSLFNEKLDSFDQQWFGENSAGSLAMSKGSILHQSLGDKSFLTDSDDGDILDRKERPKSTNPNTSGALEEALMRSPALRRAAKSTEAPKSVGRKRLNLFLEREQEESQQQQRQDKYIDPLNPPIWHYSDMMSVGVSLAADKTADKARKEEDGSKVTKHPSLAQAPAGNDLWDRATKNITTKAAHKRAKSEERRRLTKKRTSSEEQHRPSKSEHRPRKTKSRPADMRVLLEKTKSKHRKTERLTQSEHPGGGPRDDSQPVHPKQKLGSRTDHSNTKSSEPRRSSSSRHREQSRANSAGRSERHRSSSTKRRDSKKKQRSMSLSRVDLYGSEPSSPRAGSSKRRPPRKEKPKRAQSVIEGTGEESMRSLTAKGSPKRPSLGENGRLERLSRRQLIKRMDSKQSVHSNAGGAAARLSQRSLQLSQRSLQLSQRSLQVPVELSSPRLSPRRRTSQRNLMSKIERPSQRQLISKTENPVGSSPQTNRASRRNLLSKETEHTAGSSAQHRSAKSPNRRSIQLGEDPLISSGKKSPDGISGKVPRRVFMKRMESVNSFFGVGQGEIGAAYPTARQNNIVQLSDVRETNGNIDDLVLNLRRRTKQSIMKKFKSCRNLGIGGLR
jgi:hypothetical protein